MYYNYSADVSNVYKLYKVFFFPHQKFKPMPLIQLQVISIGKVPL